MRARRRRQGRFGVFVAVSALAVAAVVAGLATRADRPAAAVPLELRRSAAGDRVFGDALPAFAIALDAERRGGDPQAVDAAAAELRAAAAELPAELARALERLAGAARAASGDALLEAVRATNAALAGAGLAYRVDADLLTSGGDHVVLLLCFAVDEAVLYRAGERRLQALHVSRLDGLNWRYTLLGFTSSHSQDALILGDEIDARALAIAPALAGTITSAALGVGREAASEPYFAALAAAAAAGIGRDLDLSGAAELGALLAARDQLIATWNQRLAGRGLELAPPDGLVPDRDYRELVADIASDAELARLDQLAAELSAPAVRAAFAELRERLARSIERHEIQHLLDRRAGLAVPAPLARYVGTGADPQLRGDDVATIAVAELSAYLAELARGDLPHLQLAVLAGYLIEPGMWGRGECYAALVIAAELADELGLEAAPLVVGRRVQPERAAARYAELLAVDGQRLRQAARRSWRQLFGRPLPELSRSGRGGLDR